MLFSILLPVCSVILSSASAQNVPSNVLVIDRLALNNLQTVQPPSVENLTSVSSLSSPLTESIAD